MHIRKHHSAVTQATVIVVIGFLFCFSSGSVSAQNGSARVASLGQKESADQATDDKAANSKSSADENASKAVSNAGPGPVYGEPVEFQWRTIAKAVAVDSDVEGLFITLPIPEDWPEQTVIKGEEEIPFDVTGVEIRKLPTAPQQLLAAMPRLSKSSTAVFSLTYNISVRPTLPPDDTDQYVIPGKLDKTMKTWLDDSPGISHKDSRLRSAVKDIFEETDKDWNKVGKIKDWISNNIAISNQENADAPLTLKTESGTVENRLRLFVAMCRAAKIPARMVWAHGNDHAEFYLEDAIGTGYWFPCHISNGIALGADPKPGVVQQKGDHFRVPEKKEELNFVNGFASAKGKSRPAIGFAEGLVQE